MHSELQTLASLEHLSARMHTLQSTPLGTATRVSSQAPFHALADFLARLAAALDEIRVQAPKFLATTAFPAVASDALMSRLSSWATELTNSASLVETLTEATRASGPNGLAFLTEQERSHVEASATLVKSIEEGLREHLQVLPALESLLHPVWTWTAANFGLFENCLAQTKTPLGASRETQGLAHQANKLISAVLQIAQDVRKTGSASAAGTVSCR